MVPAGDSAGGGEALAESPAGFSSETRISAVIAGTPLTQQKRAITSSSSVARMPPWTMPA